MGWAPPSARAGARLAGLGQPTSGMSARPSTTASPSILVVGHIYMAACMLLSSRWTCWIAFGGTLLVPYSSPQVRNTAARLAALGGGGLDCATALARASSQLGGGAEEARMRLRGARGARMEEKIGMPFSLFLTMLRMKCIPVLPPRGEEIGSGREVGVVELSSASSFAQTSTALPEVAHDGGIAVADFSLVPGFVRTAIPQAVQVDGVDVAACTLAAGYARTPTPPPIAV